MQIGPKSTPIFSRVATSGRTAPPGPKEKLEGTKNPAEMSPEELIAKYTAPYRSNDGLGKSAVAQSKLASADEALKRGISPEAYMVVKPYVDQIIDQMQATS